MVASNGHDKPPLKSKKFVAFFLFELMMKALAFFIIVWAWNLDEISVKVFGLLMAIIVITGFVAVGFILGVASLDKYVRLAQIAMDGAKNGSDPNGSLTRVLSKGTKGLMGGPQEASKPGKEGE